MAQCDRHQPIIKLKPFSRATIPHYVWDRYIVTPRMSTYLLAFVVSDFEKKPFDVQSKRFAAYARPNAIESTGYTLQLTSDLTAFYARYFNVTYPLDKLEVIAVPDFMSGGRFIDQHKHIRCRLMLTHTVRSTTGIPSNRASKVTRTRARI